MSQEFASRILEEVNSSLGTLQIYIGVRLGIWKVMRDLGPCTPSTLASHSKLQIRYIEEWLKACAVHGYVKYYPENGTFELPKEYATVLLDETDSNYAAPFTKWIPSLALVLPQVLNAFRNGGGVPFEDFGDDCIEAIGEGNRPMYVNELKVWIEKLPDIHKKLMEGGVVADIGCGKGYSAIAIAKAYPKVKVYALDIDEESVKRANVNISNEGLENQIQAFHSSS